MLKKISLLTVATVLALALVMPVGQVFAAESATIGLSVTITSTLSVSVDTPSVDFGPIATDDHRQMTDSGGPAPNGPIVVTNDGSGIDEDYWLSCSDSENWDLGSVEDSDVFVMEAEFNTNSPIGFGHPLSNDPTESTATVFAGDQTGENVPYNADRNLWLRISTPTTSSVTGAQTMTVTVTAAAS